MGHGAALTRRGCREPDARGGRRRPRVVLGRGPDLLPRGRARRTRPPRAVVPRGADPGRPPGGRVHAAGQTAGPPRRTSRSGAGSTAPLSARVAEPGERPAESGLEVGARLPAEVRDRAARVERRPLELARTGVAVLRRLGEVGEARPSCRRARCTLVSTPVPMLIDEPAARSVARTNASTTSSTNTKSRVWPPSPKIVARSRPSSLPAKIATTPGFAVRVLARAVHVGEREHGGVEALDLAVVVQVVADRLLRHAVRRQRVLRVALAHRAAPRGSP